MMSVCVFGSQRVASAHITSAAIGDVDVVIDHDDDAAEIGVRSAAGRDQARHLGVAGMLLLDRDHVDEARRRRPPSSRRP